MSVRPPHPDPRRRGRGGRRGNPPRIGMHTPTAATPTLWVERIDRIRIECPVSTSSRTPRAATKSVAELVRVRFLNARPKSYDFGYEISPGCDSCSQPSTLYP